MNCTSPKNRQGGLLFSLLFMLVFGAAIAAGVIFFMLYKDELFPPDEPTPQVVQEQEVPAPEPELEAEPAPIAPEPDPEPEPEPEPEIDPQEALMAQVAIIREPVSLRSEDGRTIEVHILNLEAGEIKVLLANGQEMSFPVTLLNEESQAFVEEHKEAILYLAEERRRKAMEEARRAAAAGQITSLPRFRQATDDEPALPNGARLKYEERDPSYIDTEITFRDENREMWPNFVIGRPIDKGFFTIDQQNPEFEDIGWRFTSWSQSSGGQERRVMGDLSLEDGYPDFEIKLQDMGNLTDEDERANGPYYPVLLSMEFNDHSIKALGRLTFNQMGRGPGRGLVTATLRFSIEGAAMGLSTGTSSGMIDVVLHSNGRLLNGGE
ncbi:MAG: hypothetical protein LAT55_01625 [Opitutales bacterium]|nr:hypothetical protein [Opitutales bacterium]